MEITRRDFVKWTLMTGVAVGLAGCAIPTHQALVSQLDLPEYRLPGVPRWFATSCQECGAGCGISVRVMDGRAKKLEGIAEHPVNHGKVCARGHSSLQALYNPDRLPVSLEKKGDRFSPINDWKEISKRLALQLDSASQNPGSMLWITPSLHGTKGALIAYLAEKVGARVWALDFPGSQPERSAMKGLTGKGELPYYDLRSSDFVVNFGSDFLLTGHSVVHDGWLYGEFRQGKKKEINGRGTLVSFSPRVNATVANSDKWIPVRPGFEGWVALGVGNLLANSKRGEWPKWAGQVSIDAICKMTGVAKDIYEKLAQKLENAKHPLVVGGKENGTYTNGVWSLWMIQALNRLLSGKIQSFEPNLLIPLPDQKKIPEQLFVSAREALAGLQQEKFQTVWVLETNPVYLFPSKSSFENLFAKAKNKVVFTPYMNETAQAADLILATVSWLEEWGDQTIEGPYGVNSKRQTLYNLQQPVAMVPDWSGSMSTGDILLGALRESKWKNMRDLLKSRFPDEETWENALLRGGIWDEYPLDWELYKDSPVHPLYPPPVVKTKGKAPQGVSAWNHLKKVEFHEAIEPRFSGEKNGQVLIPYYSPTLGDGSLANRPWMQELPDPMTTTVWTHWVEIPVSLADSLGIQRGDVVRIASEGGSLEGPAFPNPGLHPEAVAVPVGQGHTTYGQYADRGANPLSMLDPQWQDETGEPAWVSNKVRVEKLEKKGRMTTLDTRMNRLPREILTI